MRLASIASGSSGNCTYVGSDHTHILVDTGCSKKRIDEGLAKLSLTRSDISAIFVTHEHTDHIAGLHTILKKYDIPVYATDGTIAGIRVSDRKGTMAGRFFERVRADEPVEIGDLEINPMSITHDAAEPVGYRIRCGSVRMAVATDMGCFSEYTVQALSGMDALLLEANHDVRMLQSGPYPYALKRRILSEQGHLSNEKSGELLSRIMNDHIRGIILGHLSRENNLPELATRAVQWEIEAGDNPYHGNDIPLTVAKRMELSDIIEV